MVFDFNEKMDKLMEHEAPWDKIIFEYYMNFIPYFSNLFSPLFVFIAVIFFTSKLAENSEIIAMFSTGMSFKSPRHFHTKFVCDSERKCYASEF